MIATDEPIADTSLVLMPKQFEFVTDDEHVELLYSGAFGAGKSRALCVRAVRLAQYRGARVGLARKTLSDLKASTVITLLEADGELPPVLPAGSYTYHKAAQRIQLNGGGEIDLFGVDQPEKVASRPFTDICVDEGIELDKDEWDMLLGRIRVQYKRPDGTFNHNSIACATNPGPPLHFLHDRFYVDQNPTRRLIETNTSENYYLPDTYIRTLNELTGPARNRYFLGLWVAYEGAVFPMFDPAVHIVEQKRDWSYYVCGVDVGMTNPSSFRMHGVDATTRASHVVAEVYESGMVSPELVKRATVLNHRFGPCTFVVDPAAADVVKQLRNAGFSVRHSPERDVLAGIRCVQASLTHNEKMPPAMTMDPGCRDGNREYVVYRWADTAAKDRPVKEMDHAVDADRYARTYIAAGLGEPVHLIALGKRSDAGRLHAPQHEPPGVPGGAPWNPVLDRRLWPRR